MATTVITPSNNNSNNWVGFLIGGVVLIILAVLFIIYVLPYIQGFSGGNGGVQVNVPKQIDVKVQQPK